MRTRRLMLLLGFMLLPATLLLGTPSQGATIANGYRIEGAVSGCSASDNSATGAGVSGFLSETDCVLPTGFKGTFSLAGSSSANYGTVRGSARVQYSGVDVPPAGGASASGGARFADRITLDVVGRTGEIVDLVFQAELNGTTGAAASGEGGTGTPFSNASANMAVSVAGARTSAGVSSRSDGTSFRSDPETVRVAITLGEAFVVSVDLTTSASIRVDGGSSGNVSGFASAAFSNSGGITSFALFDSSGTAIPDFTMTSESGQFALYQPVPEPGSALLLGLGLIGLQSVRRREA